LRGEGCRKGGRECKRGDEGVKRKEAHKMSKRVKKKNGSKDPWGPRRGRGETAMPLYNGLAIQEEKIFVWL
jgi:hypothetical protein